MKKPKLPENVYDFPSNIKEGINPSDALEKFLKSSDCVLDEVDSLSREVSEVIILPDELLRPITKIEDLSERECEILYSFLVLEKHMKPVNVAMSKFELILSDPDLQERKEEIPLKVLEMDDALEETMFENLLKNFRPEAIKLIWALLTLDEEYKREDKCYSGEFLAKQLISTERDIITPQIAKEFKFLKKYKDYLPGFFRK